MSDFSFLFAIYEGGSGNPATPNDCALYAQAIGAQSFPVFADGSRTIANNTPMTQNTHPEMCALAPDMTIISCYSGHGAHNQAFAAIRTHAGL